MELRPADADDGAGASNALPCSLVEGANLEDDVVDLRQRIRAGARVRVGGCGHAQPHRGEDIEPAYGGLVHDDLQCVVRARRHVAALAEIVEFLADGYEAGLGRASRRCPLRGAVVSVH
jgi:hypothetical protein